MGREIGDEVWLRRDMGEELEDRVGKMEGEGDIVLGLVSGIREDDGVVGGRLLDRMVGVERRVDVGGVVVNGGKEGRGIGVEDIVGFGIGDFVD